MKFDIEAIRSNDRQYATALYALCSRVAGTVTRRANMPEYAGDLTSELLIIVLERLPEIYDGTSEIEAFVWEAGRRLVLGQHRRGKREVSASEVTADGSETLVDTIPDESIQVAEEWAQDLVTRERALEAKTQLIAQMRDAARTAAVVPTGAAVASRSPSRMMSSKRMRSTQKTETGDPKLKRKPWLERSQLGYTQANMAMVLGISPSHYRRLEEQGPPPPRFKERLEVLLQQSQKVLPTSSGPDLIKNWGSRLGIEADDVSAMAAMLGVHRTTIFRWSTGRADPPPSTIRLIEARIDAMLEVRKAKAAQAQ